ncbi:MAG: SDR family oxidoreductase [Gammaproteobacteria bacterium]|nr:SDR family oxidoreductase [Gammaproteobacteria bacterium]
MNLELDGKTALVTGASKGIGRAVAEALAREGCNLHLAARGAEGLADTAAAIRRSANVAVETHAVDLSRAHDQQALFAACADVDIVVNNAGSNPAGELDEIDEQTWRSSWDLKVFGFINLCRAYYGQMKTRGSGVIVNVVGNSGERMNPMYILGSSGNASLMAFSRALGARSTDFGVRVLAVNPGLTATDRASTMLRAWSQQKYGTEDRWREFEAQMNLPFGRMGTAAEVADVVVFMASGRAGYVSGTVVTVDGGATNRNH